jgi:transcriptional regulator with XRE-family HTH domain
MFLGKRIKELREKRQILQRYLAGKLDMDTPMYSKIERGNEKRSGSKF